MKEIGPKVTCTIQDPEKTNINKEKKLFDDMKEIKNKIQEIMNNIIDKFKIKDHLLVEILIFMKFHINQENQSPFFFVIAFFP